MKTKTLSTKLLATLLACLLAGMVLLTGCSNQEPEAVEEVQETIADGEVVETITAEGWTETSTPIVFHFANEEADINFYHAVSFADNGESIFMAPGEYTCEAIMPINADGTTYDAIEPVTLTVSSNEVTNESTNLVLKSEPVTEDVLDAYLTDIKNAAKDGDDSLNSEVVSSIESTVEAIKANLSVEAVDNATEAGTDAQSDAAAQSTPAPKASAPAQSAPQASAPAPVHEHNWVQQYTTETTSVFTCCDGATYSLLGQALDHEGGLGHGSSHVTSGVTTKQFPAGFKCSGCGATK